MKLAIRTIFGSRGIRRSYAVFVLVILFGCAATGQDITDKTVATVAGAGQTPQLITYSDLVWQLALQPGTPAGQPTSEQLNAALQLVINQRLILQEAARLPGSSPTEQEIKDEQARLIKLFPSQSELQDRMNRVGLTSDQLREIIQQRVTINKYLDFRFRSFTVVSPAEVSDYYKQVYVPRFRRQQPGRIVPTLEQASADIEHTLTESKIESDTQQFLEQSRDRAEVMILNPV